MGVRPDTQHQHVEHRHRSVVLRTGRGGQFGGVRGRRRIDVMTVRPVRRWHRVHPGRVQRHRVQQGLAGLRDIAFRIAVRQEPLVAPPQVEPRPVDRVPGGRVGERGQQAVAVATAGEHHRGVTACGLGVHDLRDQPGRDGLRHQLLVAVHDELRDDAHFDAAFFAGAAVFLAAGAAGDADAPALGFAASPSRSTPNFTADS